MPSRPLTSTPLTWLSGSKEMTMQKAKYFGWEFKSALTTAIYKIAADLGLDRVYVTFKDEIPTAAINRHGQIYITNIADDAVLTRADLERYTDYALHEMLHWWFPSLEEGDIVRVSTDMCRAMWLDGYRRVDNREGDLLQDGKK